MKQCDQKQLSETELMVLSAIAHSKYQDYKHLINVFQRLKNLQLIKVLFDEQGQVILATATPKGKRTLNQYHHEKN